MKLYGPTNTICEGIVVDFYQRNRHDLYEPVYVSWKNCLDEHVKTQVLTQDESAVLWDHLLAQGYRREETLKAAPIRMGRAHG